MSEATTLEFTLEPNDSHRLANLCGTYDKHLKLLEERLNVEVRNRGNQFNLHGNTADASLAQGLLAELWQETENKQLTPEMVHLHLSNIQHQPVGDKPDVSNTPKIHTRKSTIAARPGNQSHYINNIRTHDINFGIGPAGTGKTFLAVCMAAETLIHQEIERIILVRPAVEAGEKLGFLPGDLAQKVDPYLRPLYDALYETLGYDSVGKMIEKNIIEIAPLAYMRGRTLNNAFIILDEAQNTTREQMKMFLTRIGFGSTAVITGDLTQIDLPGQKHSGLKHALQVLKGQDGISFTHFVSKDVVRHPLVQRIVEAYEAHENSFAEKGSRHSNKDTEQ